MSRNLASIAEEALKLPEHEQLKLARTLLEKSEAEGDQSVEAVWEQEIERRSQLIDGGLAKGRPFTDVLRDIDRQLDSGPQSVTASISAGLNVRASNPPT